MFKANAYITEVIEKYKTGRAGEHAYRPSLEKLIRSLDPKLGVINDPKRTEHGAPDFIFVKGELIAGYAETKDINIDLDKTVKSEQLERYFGYSNLILTNYLEFRFFRNGEPYGNTIIIGRLTDGSVQIIEESVTILESAIADFLTAKPETIKSGVRLAKIMGGKARRIRDNVKQFLVKESNDENKELLGVYSAIKSQLVNDLNAESFSDMYAQTLVYGLFVARYSDDSPDTFSRLESKELIPESNPFLRSFFDHIAGINFDKRLGYIVDELCEIFRCSDVRNIIDKYYADDQAVAQKDQIIHFYEDFLKEYDPVLRKKMGAYYTPLPVVRFIVRAVDQILQKDFKLARGLADTSKLPNGLHRVQVLDPAVGTGTFIGEVINNIYSRFIKQQGAWPAYVHHDLLLRIYGFELMMASYTIAHLKLSLAFKKTGFKYFNETKKGKSRLGIYLTNSLEQMSEQETLPSLGFSQSIAEEAKEASVVKNTTPIMVVIGNPPYSVSSSNKGKWIQDQIKVYKEGLGERKINLDDDYIKFIRFAEHFIEKNKTGVVAMITNNSFIDGITHRQMRKHLLGTFDEIYVLDLHGNSKKKEKAPDDGKDENVFDIQQGVSINIFVRKNESKKGFGAVYHSEFFGKRESKFEMLNKSDIEKIKWQKLDYSEPYFFFVPKDFGLEKEYKAGFGVNELFVHYNSGIQTKRDDTVIQFNLEDIKKVEYDFQNLTEDQLREKYQLPNDGRDWSIKWAQDDLKGGSTIEQMQYRPFDNRYTIYTGHAKGFVAYPREKTNQHIVKKENISLLTSRMIPPNQDFNRVFVTKNISDIHSASDQTYVFPLYLYNSDNLKTPNLKQEVIGKTEKVIGKTTPEDIFDYIYAILHSLNYREKYKEFLKIDFPRIPYPKDAEVFKKLVELGTELRLLHLLESSKLNQFITSYPEDGSNLVEKITYKDGKVFINSKQYFGDVPEIAWNFWIGGYQPAQKWLKDRKGRVLTSEDIEHYQKIIVVLVETDKIMKEIDNIQI